MVMGDRIPVGAKAADKQVTRGRPTGRGNAIPEQPGKPVTPASATDQERPNGRRGVDS